MTSATTPTTVPLVDIRGLRKRYGSNEVLKGVDLHIDRGEVVSIIGKSGSGKSTLLRCINGLESFQEGQLSVHGQPLQADQPQALRELRKNVGMIFQSFNLFPHLSVGRNVMLAPSLVMRQPQDVVRANAQRLLERVGLAEKFDAMPDQLSGGQQQRVALGRALVAQAHVCLMDEPLSNLDAQLRQEMRAELRELQQRLGLTVVYVTHDQAEAMSMADQVVLLHQGRVEQCATPRALYAQPATTFAARFIGTPAMNLVQLQDGAIAGSSVRLPAPTGAAWLGLRPEAVALSGEARVPAQVVGLEYLGADVVLRCQVGSEQITVRAPGQQAVQAGQALPLAWPPQAMHFFDAAGQRLA